jgi:hypothetical protein
LKGKKKENDPKVKLQFAGNWGHFPSKEKTNNKLKSKNNIPK